MRTSYKFALALLAIVVCNSAMAEIESKEDRFTGSYKIQTKPYASPNSEFGFSWLYEEDKDGGVKTLGLIMHRTSKSWRYLQCHSTAFLADGKPLDLGRESRSGHVGSGYVNEFLIINTSLTKLKTAAQSRKVEYKVCNDEFSMSDRDLTDLREFVRLVTERGHAK